jgi:hypothetical protein
MIERQLGRELGLRMISQPGKAVIDTDGLPESRS